MPAPRKSNRQNPRDTPPELEVLPGGRGQVPDLPRPANELLKATKDGWTSFWTSDLSQYVKSDSDRAALGRLFCLYDERERLYRVYRKQRVTKGSTGQLVMHPAAKEIASLDARIVQLEDRFGLSPMARLKLGVKFGEAVASLDEINRRLESDDDEDPRQEFIEVDAREA